MTCAYEESYYVMKETCCCKCAETSQNTVLVATEPAVQLVQQKSHRRVPKSPELRKSRLGKAVYPTSLQANQ